MDHKKKRIVIWGIGKYGRFLHRLITDTYSDRYSVIGFADRKYEVLNSSNSADVGEMEKKRILGYSELKYLTDEGCIDGVVIGILDLMERKKVEDLLSVMGIQVLDSRCLGLVSASQICDKRTNCIFNETNINIYALSDVNIVSFADWNEDASISYACDDSGNIILESDRYLGLSNHPLYNIGMVERQNTKTTQFIDKAVSLLTWGSDFNYGHFIFSCLSKIHVLENNNYDGCYLIYDKPFIREWINIVCRSYQISEDRFVWIKPEKAELIMHIGEFYCTDNIIDSGKINAEILNEIAEKILLNGICNDRDKSKRLYLKRAGSRKLIGGEELLEQYGFEVFRPEEYSIEDQIRTIHSADIVAAEHGAAVANCLFMKKGSALIETFGAGFVDAFFVEMAKVRGVRYRMLVSQKEYGDYNFEDDYGINPSLLQMTIEEIL